MRPLIRNSIAIGGLAALLSAAAPAIAQTEISFDLARQLGRQAALSGDVGLASQFSESLLAADAADFDALIIRASVMLQIDEPREARRAAAAAYQAAAEPLDRYEAARLAALAARNEGRFGIAQFWLRLASVHAPTQEGEAQSLADAAQMRALSRWQTSVSLSLSPSDNVNGGSPDEDFTVNGVATGLAPSRDAQPLEGWRGALSFSARYRLRETTDTRLTAGITGTLNTVWLSDDAKEELIADGRYFGNQAFTNRQLEANLTYDRTATNGSWTVSGAAGLRHAYDDDDLEIAHFVRLGLSRSYVLDARNVLRGTVFVDQAWDVDTSRRDKTRLGWSGTYIHAFENSTIVSTTLSYTDTDSDIGNQRFSAWTASVAVQPGDQIGPFAVTANLGMQFTDYPDYAVFQPVEGGRQDERIFAGLDLALPDYSIAGFEPVIRVDASTATSNVSRFEYDTFGIGLSFQSSF